MVNKERIKNYGEYLEAGIVEAGKDENINVDATVILKSKTGKMPDSVFVLQHFCQLISSREDYKTVTFRVLFYLISITEYENYVSVDVKTMAENMGISEPSIKRATKQLSDDNILKKIPHPSDKRRVDYFINPMALWRGKTLNRDKFLNAGKSKKMKLDLFPNPQLELLLGGAIRS